MTAFRLDHDLPPKRGWRALHLSDLHLGKSRDVPPRRVFEAWLELALPACDADHLIISGDLVDVPEDRQTLEHIRDTLNAIAIPWSVIPGNHDVLHPDTPGAFGELFGTYPRVETSGTVGLLLFDSFGGLPFANRLPDEQARLETLGHLAHGAVPPEQWDALPLEPSRESDRLVVVHHHLHEDPDDAHNLGSMHPLFGAEDFIARARALGALAILHGHKHAPVAPVDEDGIWVVRGGASTKPPFKARAIDIHDHELSWSELILTPA